MCKLITSSKDSDDVFIGFDCSRKSRVDELTANKNVKGKNHLRITLRDVFGCAEQQEKATYGLGYKLTLTRDNDNAVIDKAGGFADARIKNDHIHWYIPHYTPSIQLQSILSHQILSLTPTELRYVERCFHERSKKSKLMEFRNGRKQECFYLDNYWFSTKR